MPPHLKHRWHLTAIPVRLDDHELQQFVIQKELVVVYRLLAVFHVQMGSTFLSEGKSVMGNSIFSPRFLYIVFTLIIIRLTRWQQWHLMLGTSVKECLNAQIKISHWSHIYQLAWQCLFSLWSMDMLLGQSHPMLGAIFYAIKMRLVPRARHAKNRLVANVLKKSIF